ncbi:F-actin-monooxygenase MICAL2 isoform X14 [Alligator sinensis]|uniref:F-actin monooxygenase n=1 Tax=Alligator sinensis TaxID=38654 RepID=A0A3Q0H0K9_ALLSI|nr:F-actin-monooxygenase MICAL2 isoform X14 [Alligator sinensis]
MGENDDEKCTQAGHIFENFVQASTCKGTIQAFNILTRQLELDPLDNRNFYIKLKSKITSWKAKALWNKLDKRASHKEYKRGKSCMNTKCLIVGGGPCGLRTAIELAFLGAKVVVVEKRDTFSRNNVLHLWPYTIHDLRGLGAKKFYGKFCAGSIDHISIWQLQLILFKVALMLGVEIHVNLEFVKVLEPPEDQENQKIGWRAEFLPVDHPLSEFEFDVIIGADGRRNTLEGFRRKEFRGKLAIAITANFINRNTTAEAKVEEISGVAFIFNQKFFQDLKEETGIDLENIVYYKDSTHYFVMTAKKQSLLDKGVIINDYIDTEMLLCGENVNQENLLSYAREAADFATNYQLPSLDFAINHYGQSDVAMFDFTSMYASENAALVRERQRHQLLVALVGDSLLEPFWPMGTGCARGFLAAFDTAWMVKSWSQGKPPLEILAERESIYRLLPQTTPENINKNFDQYTIDPGTRYPNLNSSCVRSHQVRHLYVTNELQQCPLERVSSIRRSVNLSRHESDIRPNKLLTWCQKQTEGYRNVDVTDLTTSWRSGLALCAIMHRFRPDLIDFDSLNEEDAVKNNQLAFDIAEREFGIPPVTTGKEMASAGEPDKLSMVMYLSKFYELFRGTPLRAVDAVDKQNGENNDLSSAKSSNSIFNYINLTLPRKRVPKVERKEENETKKRRRKGLSSGFEEASSFSNQETNSGKDQGDGREGVNKNKVKSMATQLLAKFEENAPNTSLRRQELVDKPALLSSCHPPVKPCFAKPQDPSPPPQPKWQMTVGKVSRGIGAVAEVLVSLYMNDHRPKPQFSFQELNQSLDGDISSFPTSCSVSPTCASTIQSCQVSLRKEFPQTVGGSDICYFCKKRVYVMERLSAEGHFFHRECFKCDVCSTTLRLGIYAFDVEEGKFYCKPHFTHCKISNKHRKRRATLPIQEKGDAEMWKKEESKPPETTTESTLTTVSSSEDRPPDYYLLIADEPTSPKKPKNVTELSDFESICPSLSPEWASVRVIPEEEMTERNLMAIRVMVTSDGSSSEPESDFYGDSSNSEVSEGKISLPEAISSTNPRKYASSTRSSEEEEEYHEKSKVADALQRANSFRSSSSNKYQNWRRKLQSNFPLLYSKKPGLHSKENSGSIQSALEDDLPPTQLMSNNKPPEITRHFKPYSPIFKRKSKTRETPEEIPLYVLHHPVQNSIGDSFLKHSESVSPDANLYNYEYEDGNAEEYKLETWNENIREQEPLAERGASRRKIVDLSSLNLEEKDEKNSRHPKEKAELNEIKKRITRKLMLSSEQQFKLNVSNNADLSGTKPGYQSNRALEISEQKDADNNARENSISVLSPFENEALPIVPVNAKDIQKSLDNTGGEQLPSQPKSPLKLIASAIKKSILEPLISPSESIKKSSDSKRKPHSEHTFFSFPNNASHSVSLNNSNGGQPQGSSVPRHPGEESELRNSSKTSSNIFTSLEEKSPYGYTEVHFPACSLHTSPSKPEKSSYTKIEDVPRLLEKFTLKETPLRSSGDDMLTSKQKNLSVSSLRLKNKISKDNTVDPSQRSDIRTFFTNFRTKVTEREKKDPSKSSVPINRFFPEEVLSHPSTGSEHLAVRKQVTECYSSSSDNEIEHKPSLAFKVKRSLKRKKKLEKETKQLIKQEQLRRLHKAQAIQRQLEELEERQTALETRGVKLERELRGESDSGTQDETQLLHEWFELALEKNKLMRYESELLVLAQELELEDHQSRLEQELREKMAIDDSLKDEKDLKEENEIFIKMMRVIAERDKLVSSLEQQRLKKKAEDQHFESFMLPREYPLNRT